MRVSVVPTRRMGVMADDAVNMVELESTISVLGVSNLPGTRLLLLMGGPGSD